jgi:hypothetical protein
MTRVCLADAFMIMRLQVAASFRWEGNTSVGNGYTYFEGIEIFLNRCKSAKYVFMSVAAKSVRED